MDYVSKIGERIRTLREEKGLTQQGLADSLHVKRETINMWENGFRDLKTGSVVSLANFFDVSADYLLGRTECKSTDIGIQSICQKTGLNEDAISNLQELKNNHTELVNTAISLISDFDNLFWITSSIHEISIRSAVIDILEDWMKTSKKSEENASFFVSEHTRLVKERRHALFDCLESFRDVAERAQEEITKDLVIDLKEKHFADELFSIWRENNAQR